MQQYKELIGTLNYWLFLALIVALPYPNAITRPLWVAFLISYLLEGRLFARPSVDKERLTRLLPLIGICVWVAWEAISALWATDPTATWSLVGRHINFGAVLIIAIFGTNEQWNSRTILKTFIGSAVASIPIYLMIHYWLLNPAVMTNKDWFMENQSIDWIQLQELTFNMKHRLYYATLLCMSIVGMVVYYRPLKQEIGVMKATLITIFVLLTLMAGIYWSGSRQTVLNLAAMFSIWALWNTPGRKKIITACVLLVGLVLGAIGYVKVAPRFATATDAKDIFAFEEEKADPSFEPRIAIWHAALEQPQDYLLYGVGAGCSTAYMTKKYEEKGWTNYARRQFSPHNQYLVEMIELGVVAAVLFVLLWCSIPFHLRGNARKAAWYIVAIIMLNMATEMFVGCIDGVLTCCVMLLYLTQLSEQETGLSRGEAAGRGGCR